MLRLALTPRWIGLLLVALALASAFAWLGSWQLARSRANAEPVVISDPRPITEVLRPQAPLPDIGATTPVIAEGELDASQAVVVKDRRAQGEPVRWLVAPLLVRTPDATARLPIVLGSLPADGPVPTPAGGAVTIQGMIQPSEEPATAPDGSATSVSSAGLVNAWGQPIYAGFLFAPSDLAQRYGLAPVAPPAPPSTTGYSVLNLSYAVQWWLFAVVAGFIWWRLLRDARTAQQLHAHQPDAHQPDEDQPDAHQPDAQHPLPRSPAR